MVYKDGTKATDDEITGLLIALLFAGQHTSSVTSTWTQLYILADPELKARVAAEQAAEVKGPSAARNSCRVGMFDDGASTRAEGAAISFLLAHL